MALTEERSQRQQILIDPITFEVLRHRLVAIVDEAADTIKRVSGSPIATEATDLNTALMSATGEVVVCGRYVLPQVMGLDQAVNYILTEYADNPGISPGDMFATNDPYVGALHQQDTLIVAPIFEGDRLIAWCGSVVHQADLGGPVPGGLSVGATSIFQEPIPMAPVRIVEGGVLRRDLEREYLIRSRTPGLVRLDLLAQISANRVQTERLLEVCAQHGSAVVEATLERLIDSTLAKVRRRLSELPDGRWSHVGFIEHDGVSETISTVALTLTKRGDHLVFDYTGSSDQADGPINCAYGSMRGYSLAALMTVLGYGLPWIPAAFSRVVTFETRPGSIVHASWPAAVSMCGQQSGHECKTAVNMCLNRLLDASDDHAEFVLSGSFSSGPGTVVSGVHASGQRSTSMLLDMSLGGMGARAFADGPDTGGILTSPGIQCTNIETNELHYPILYSYRQETPDSGGPGRFRGGVGARHAFTPFAAEGEVMVVLYSYGVQHPAIPGCLGGEPGVQNAFLVARNTAAAVVDADAALASLDSHDLPAVKDIKHLAAGDLYMSWCCGGGGLGDPIERLPDAVVEDIEAGLVTPEGAYRDYCVQVHHAEGRWMVDAAATDALRDQARRARINENQPRPAMPQPAAGRRLSSALTLTTGDAVACRRCGYQICDKAEDVKAALVMVEEPVWSRWALAARYDGANRFVIQKFFCPGCAAQLEVDVNLAGHAPIRTFELLD